MSERRACRVVGADRNCVRYLARRLDDAGSRARLKEAAAERRRFGYRRLYLLLRREGQLVNKKRVHRLLDMPSTQVASRRRRGWPAASLDPGCARRQRICRPGTEKRRLTELGNTVTMDVTATKDYTFGWRKVGGAGHRAIGPRRHAAQSAGRIRLKACVSQPRGNGILVSHAIGPSRVLNTARC